jgi:hypothetical protein
VRRTGPLGLKNVLGNLLVRGSVGYLTEATMHPELTGEHDPNSVETLKED